ncbi:3'(2'),5'-bisphosphate nucleotidase CysQ family protein [Pedomonas sp. V897]|uniref:3'(2'),5'-bisphosphate nucleotidase CysQ family protein n=1 Tax=Pedomonas sp. V897 TaxID=3446482 RepID=UPI003EE3D413
MPGFRLDLLEALIAPVRAAADAIEAVRKGGISAREKADKSPVTAADEAAEDILTAALRKLTPHIPIVGEEAYAAGVAPRDVAGGTGSGTFWLIDPVDGTRDFVRGGRDYTVNVGLIVDFEAVLGVIMSPPEGTLWAGAAGVGAFRLDADGTRRAITTRPLGQRPLIVLASYRNRDAETRRYLETLPEAKVTGRGSSIKFALLAEGAADLYPRWFACSEWDTAAGHGLLVGAGGQVFDASTGAPLRYAKPGFENIPFIAVGDAEAALARGLMPWQR